ncbi:MAG: YIP1 family protein [Candidatus Eisenbacteria bacterium]
MNEAPAPPDSPPRAGLLRDVPLLWFSPAALFGSIRERPRVRGALIVLVVVVVAATLLTLDVLVGTMMERGAESMRERGGDPSSLGFFGHPAMKAGIVVSGAVMLLLVLLVHSGGVYLALSLSGGVEEKKPFPWIFRAAVWAKLVEIPHLVLWVPLVLAKGGPDVFFGPAALASEEGAGPWFPLLSALDLFTLWFLALFAIGVSVLLRVRGLRAAATVFAPWVVWQLAKMGLHLL